MNRTPVADAVIIGGGLIGLAVANALVDTGWGKIVLLEKHQLGSGATGRSTATIDLFAQHPVPARLGLEAYQVFADFARRYGEGCGFRTSGFLVLVGSAHWQGLVAFTERCRALGIQYELLDPQSVSSLEPSISAEDLAGAAFTPLGGWADPAMAVSAMAKAARRKGAVILEGTPARPIVEGDRVVGVETNTDRVWSPVVVNATGPWAPQVAEAIAPGLPIIPVRHDVGIMAARAAKLPMAFIDFSHLTYARPETGNLLLFGSLDPNLGNTPVDSAEAPEGNPPFTTLAMAAERLGRRIPSNIEWELKGGWTGIIDLTPDYHAIIDEAPPGSGHWVVAGFSGHGFKIAPAVGRLVAQMLTGEVPLDERTFFSYSRFRDGRLHQPELLPGVLG